MELRGRTSKGQGAASSWSFKACQKVSSLSDLQKVYRGIVEPHLSYFCSIGVAVENPNLSLSPRDPE